MSILTKLNSSLTAGLMSLRFKIFHLLLSFRQIQFHFMLQLFNFEDILNLTFARYLMLFEFLEFAERSNFAEKVYSQLFAFHSTNHNKEEENPIVVDEFQK